MPLQTPPVKSATVVLGRVDICYMRRFGILHFVIPRLTPVIPAQAGGPIGRIYEIEIELPDYTTRKYKRSTSRKRSKKSRKAASNKTSTAKSTNRQRGAKQDVKITEMTPKRTRGKSATRQPKPESRRAVQKRVQENARKLQMPLF